MVFQCATCRHKTLYLFIESGVTAPLFTVLRGNMFSDKSFGNSPVGGFPGKFKPPAIISLRNYAPFGNEINFSNDTFDNAEYVFTMPCPFKAQFPGISGRFIEISALCNTIFRSFYQDVVTYLYGHYPQKGSNGTK